MWKNALGKIRKWLTKQRLVKLGWYAALAALLTILGAGSYAYRNRFDRTGARAASTAEPMAAMAAGTPQPMEALFILPTPSPEPTPEPVAFVWPIEGEIIGEYAPDRLVWSETLQQWQNHPGIDIAAAAGEGVAACADGTVTEAWEDPLWGHVIEIEHAEGYVSTYANLSATNLVGAGDAVVAGQVIASVGDSADCESELPWHLHLELTQSGAPVDPQKLME